jgi:5S rRNA maturation endonuclease (ribonuclease M5)
MKNFEDYSIEIQTNKTVGEWKTTCPQCSHTRKKKTDKCLSVNLGKRVWRCNHCEWSGGLPPIEGNKIEYKIEYKKPEWKNKTDLSEKLVKWFEARGISQNTLKNMKISEGIEWMPSVQAETNTMQFNYFYLNELINVKYRDGKKGFKLAKDAEKIFYNIDSIIGSESVYIVEGEMDVLSFVECGVKNCISVPNGAKSSLDECLNNYIDLFEEKEIIIAVDNDKDGKELQIKLLEAFDYKNCKIIDWKDCKDANEFLIQYKSIEFLNNLKNEIIAKKPSPFDSIYEDSFIDINEKIDYPPIAVSIGFTNYGMEKYPNAFATYGNFSCITGQSKSKKTFFKSLILASYIGGESIKFSSCIYGHDSKNKLIIDIDTEQSKFHAQKAFKRVMRIVGISDYKYYKPFALRPYTPKERIEFIEYLIYESDIKDNIGIISIDGIADLVEDYNDLKETQILIQKLMKWTEEKGIHIVTVLHNNHGTLKPTGHLGTAVLKKAETICAIENENDISTVTFMYTRNGPINQLKYRIEDNGLPKVFDDLNETNEYYEPKENNKIDYNSKYLIQNESDFIQPDEPPF